MPSESAGLEDCYRLLPKGMLTDINALHTRRNIPPRWLSVAVIFISAASYMGCSGSTGVTPATLAITRVDRSPPDTGLSL